MSTEVKLGFVALADCAPLAVAQAHSLFEAEGLSVTLSREPSWANIRDKVAAGVLDGAHMLGPMAIASTLGLDADPVPVIAPLALNLNGSAITISRPLADALRDIDPAAMSRRPRTAETLSKLIRRRRAAGLAPLTFAVVFPYSVHAYELRHWLAAGGIDPASEVRIVVAPPARMVESLVAGEIDGFCVGAPWNAAAFHSGVGEILVHASEIWPRSPDKVFGVTEAWARANPETLSALIRAMVKAAAWADERANRPALATLLARPEWVDAPEAVMNLFLSGPGAPAPHPFDDPDYIVFHRGGANRPDLRHAHWFLEQMARWGQLPAGVDIAAIAARVYRPDLYDAAFAA